MSCIRAGSRIISTALLAAVTVAVQAQTVSVPGTDTPTNFTLAVGGSELVAEPSDSAPLDCHPADSGHSHSSVRSGLCGTIAESIFGKPDPDAWRPLLLSTLFTEGWDEAWVPSPRGSGGAPRQAWINSAAGYLARTQFLTFAQGFNQSPKEDGYLGSYTLLTPLNRRLEIITSVPFVLRNNVDSGLPIIDPPGLARLRQAAAARGRAPVGQRVPTTESNTGFGDVSFTPRLLLHETQDFSLTTELVISTPTGTAPLAGNTTILTPNVSFWNNVAGGWVVRGGLGVAIPTQGGGE